MLFPVQEPTFNDLESWHLVHAHVVPVVDLEHQPSVPGLAPEGQVIGPLVLNITETETRATAPAVLHWYLHVSQRHVLAAGEWLLVWVLRRVCGYTEEAISFPEPQIMVLGDGLMDRLPMSYDDPVDNDDPQATVRT